MSEKGNGSAPTKHRAAKVETTSTYARSSVLSTAGTKKPTKRERVMLAFDEAVASLAPGPRFSALKGNLMYVLHEKWSMARKIEFFQRFAADSRRLAR
jgi:hypothetical protein